jgi:hypothetical protein
VILRAGYNLLSTPFSLGSIQFVTSNAEQMRITAGGNVGIGTASPVSYANYRTLAMAGAATGAVIDMGPGTNLQTSGGLQIATTATGTDINAQGPSGGAAAVLRFSAGTWGAVPARMLVSGSGTQAQSQVAIGTSSFTSGCSLTVAQSIDASQSAQGLKLPATPGNADTQTLDCYEENTWVPTLSGFGGTAPTVQTARYTRIGRMVVCNLVLVATGGNQFSASTGTPTYVTLPFTPATDGAAPVTNSGVAALGPGLIGTNARFYIPTFALTTATTSATIIFTV